MKRFILSAILMHCAVFMTAAQDKPELARSENIKNLIEAPLRSGDFKSEDFWKGIPVANISEEANIFRYPAEKKWTGPKDLSASFQAAYDDKNIYFKINVNDDKIVKRSKESSEGDEIEIYMAFPEENSSMLSWGKNMFQLRIIPFDSRGVFLGYKDPMPIPDSKSFTQTTESGFSVVASMPWNSLNYRPETGKIIPFDLRLMDSDIPGKPIKVSMMWNNFPDKLKPWKTGSGWGALKFVKNFSKPYLDGERILINGAEREAPLKPDEHTLFLANFDRNCNAVFSKGNPSPDLKGKAQNTTGLKGKFGEALKAIEDYQSVCSYECKNNMDMNNGTIELWFKSKKKPKDCRFPFFWCIRSHPFGGKQKNALSLQYDQRVEALTLSISDNNKQGHNLVIPFKLEPGKWNHLAATWRNLNSGKTNAELRFYANGHECLDKIENVRIDFKPPENSRFFLGSSSTEVYKKGSNPAHMDIDDFRISDIPRNFSNMRGESDYIPKRTKNGKLIETRYLCCSLPGTKREIDEIIKIANESNYNVLSPSVNPGDYKSDLSMMKPEFALLDFDPLAYMIEKAHEKNIEVHPYSGIGALNRVFWPCVMYDGKVAEDRLNPGNPKVRDYIVNEMLELTENYDVDGIGLDFIRYSSFNYSKDEAELMKKKYGVDIFSFGKNPAASLDPARLKWFKWRENNIHDIVRRVWTETRKVDPGLIIAAYVWNSTPPRIAQAWETWTKNGWLNRILVMNYSKLAGEVSAIHRESQKRSGSPDMLSSVLATFRGYIRDAGGITPMTTEELAKQIKAIRKYNSPGIGHFSLDWTNKENILNLNKSVFAEKSLPSFRTQKRQKIKRKQRKREFDISSIAYNDGNIKDSSSSSILELPQKKIVGGICVKSNEKFKAEFLDEKGNWNLLCEGFPGAFGLASLITFPPVKAKKIRVEPAKKLLAATPFFGTDQNTVNMDIKDWKIISPTPEADPGKLKGTPLINISKSGQAFFEAENGKKSGNSLAIKKCGKREFADMPRKNLKGSNPSDTDGSLSFVINIEEEGYYELWANVNGPNPGADSLFIEFGGKRQAWHITTHGRFEWRCLCYGFRESKKYIMFHLKPGKYLLKITWREADAKIDKLCFRKHKAREQGNKM